MFKNRSIIIMAVVVAATAAIAGYYIWKAEQDFVAQNPMNEFKEKVSAPVPSVRTGVVGQEVNNEATAAPAETVVQNATALPDEDSGPAEVAAAEDPVVTGSFIDELSRFLVDHYHPAEAQDGGKSFSSASFISLNKYFGSNLLGFSFQESTDLDAARQEILDHLLTPGIIKNVFALYADNLVDQLAAKAARTDKEIKGRTRPLTEAETSDMFQLNSAKLRSISAAMKAVAANPGLMESISKYLIAVSRVEVANADFQQIMDEQGVGGPDTAEAGKRLKLAITDRERIKAGVVSTLKNSCGNCASDGALFYIAQWVHRRTVSDMKRMDFVATGAELLAELSTKFTNKADEIKNAPVEDN